MLVHHLSLLGLAACAVAACADPVRLARRGAKHGRRRRARSARGGERPLGDGRGLREFTFHAIGQPDGPVNDSYKVVLPNGLFFEADVICLAVDGTTA